MTRKGCFTDYYGYVKTLPCLVRDGCCFGAVEGHHVRSRGAGGTDVEGHGSHGNLIPLCAVHHREGHMVGWKTWQQRHGVDTQSEAERTYRCYANN